MKKINNSNRFRNNNNGNSVYSLNYKFDSVSTAGKFTGTALDLIKLYNELAKEAQSRGDYVDMEVFRQYAEHYRKIVTEINSRKNQAREANAAELENTITNIENASEQASVNDTLVETQPATQEQTEQTAETLEKTETPKVRRLKRGFTVVEVTKAQTEPEVSANENELIAENTKMATVEETQKPKRRRITSKKNLNTETNAVEND